MTYMTNSMKDELKAFNITLVENGVHIFPSSGHISFYCGRLSEKTHKPCRTYVSENTSACPLHIGKSKIYGLQVMSLFHSNKTIQPVRAIFRLSPIKQTSDSELLATRQINNLSTKLYAIDTRFYAFLLENNDVLTWNRTGLVCVERNEIKRPIAYIGFEAVNELKRRSCMDWCKSTPPSVPKEIIDILYK